MKEEDIPVYTFNKEKPLYEALRESGLVYTYKQAIKYISFGAVKIDGNKVLDQNMMLQKGEYILQVGKRLFAKVIIN